jgi:hypothetical protein
MKKWRRFRWLIVIVGIWFLSSLQFISLGPAAFVAGPLSLPWIIPTTYQRFVGAPMFRRGLRAGMSRAEVNSLARRGLAYRVDESDGQAEVKFSRTETFCAFGGDLWIIRFDRGGRAASWTTGPWGENC